MDTYQAEQVAAQSWASEVAKKISKEQAEEERESYCIDSTRTIKRQQDIFYKNHKFKRKI